MTLRFFSTLPLVPLSNFITRDLQMLINPYRISVVSDRLGQRSVLSLLVSVCVHIFLSLSFYPSHYMQQWGCQETRPEKRTSLVLQYMDKVTHEWGGGPRESEKERGRSRDDRWMDARITTLVCVAMLQIVNRLERVSQALQLDL